jgi:hypothetical protein
VDTFDARLQRKILLAKLLGYPCIQFFNALLGKIRLGVSKFRRWSARRSRLLAATEYLLMVPIPFPPESG